MIYLRFFGCVIVLVSSTLAGYSMKIKYNRRLSDFENLLSCVQILENEIRYNVNDIINSIKKVLETAKGANEKMFCGLLEMHRNSEGSTLSNLWNNTVSRYLESSCYNKDDVKMILQFGNILGSGDVETQLKNVNMFQKNIEMKIDECRKGTASNSLLCAKIGVYVGIVIVILII